MLKPLGSKIIEIAGRTGRRSRRYQLAAHVGRARLKPHRTKTLTLSNAGHRLSGWSSAAIKSHQLKWVKSITEWCVGKLNQANKGVP
jgi:hypothetical protein